MTKLGLLVCGTLGYGLQVETMGFQWRCVAGLGGAGNLAQSMCVLPSVWPWVHVSPLPWTPWAAKVTVHPCGCHGTLCLSI